MPRETKLFSDYDPFAWIYNSHWGQEFHTQVFPVLKRLALDDLERGAHVIDLCCGAGHVTERLVGAGFRVTGIDGSSEMLRYARERVPECTFILGDARTFRVDAAADAVVSTFDSLNHVIDEGDLLEVFRRTFEALRPNGWFVFDVNREEAYRDLWVQNYPIVEDDTVQIARGRYESSSRIATCDVTLFRLNRSWERADFSLRQKCHAAAEIESGLEGAGFREIAHYDACALGMQGNIAYARSFYTARR